MTGGRRKRVRCRARAHPDSRPAPVLRGRTVGERGVGRCSGRQRADTARLHRDRSRIRSDPAVRTCVQRAGFSVLCLSGPNRRVSRQCRASFGGVTLPGPVNPKGSTERRPRCRHTWRSAREPTEVTTPLRASRKHPAAPGCRRVRPVPGRLLQGAPRSCEWRGRRSFTRSASRCTATGRRCPPVARRRRAPGPTGGPPC
jgi:hypothetical protein